MCFSVLLSDWGNSSKQSGIEQTGQTVKKEVFFLYQLIIQPVKWRCPVLSFLLQDGWHICASVLLLNQNCFQTYLHSFLCKYKAEYCDSPYTELYTHIQFCVESDTHKLCHKINICIPWKHSMTTGLTWNQQSNVWRLTPKRVLCVDINLVDVQNYYNFKRSGLAAYIQTDVEATYFWG